jgi:rod shape-determining protein MreD
VKVQNLYQLMLVVLTFVIGIMLSLLPMPGALAWFRPHWVLLVLIYWTRMLPRSVGFLVAWVSGLGLDSIQGSVLGQHPLGFVVVALLVNLMRKQSHYFSYAQQLLWVGSLVGASQLISFAVELTVFRMTSLGWHICSVCVSILSWPMLAAFLKKCYRLGWDQQY